MSGLPLCEQQETRLGQVEAGAQARFQQGGNTSKGRKERGLNEEGHRCVYGRGDGCLGGVKVKSQHMLGASTLC